MHHFSSDGHALCIVHSISSTVVPGEPRGNILEEANVLFVVVLFGSNSSPAGVSIEKEQGATWESTELEFLKSQWGLGTE